MKKQLKLFSLLIVTILGTFALTNKMTFSSVNATYVEGPITQDTVWTLVDSPFVISKNITIYPNATLTIEPRVKVQFGGYFSIFVEGSLYAIGTQNDNITFTSNKDQPTAGDWGTIKFNGTAPSTLAYCVIKYATNGTTIENSNVEIQNSEISTCSQNGVTSSNGTVTIQDSQISNNSQNGIWIENSVVDAQNNEINDNVKSGIYVTGASQATIQSNTIGANKNGVYLTGNSTIIANISQNIVKSNTQSGIYVDVTDYSNIVIRYNNLSANDNGFYVSGRTSTQITNNSISFNTVGIQYKNASHTAQWNDIYDNDLGMDVASNYTVTVDAEYNYWGDESGPYHASLNPAGKGNPVGGNGESIDFVFFLTAPIGYINQRPVATLLSDKKLVPPNQKVTFFATTSSDDGRVDKFFFDFGDGSNSSWTTLSIFEHKYSVAGTFQASLRVMDDFGVISNNVANIQITVQALSPLEVALTLSRSNISSEGQVSIIAKAKIGTSPVGNANITFFAIKVGSFTPQSGLTNSTGYFTATFTAPNVTKETNVRITATASKSVYADGSDYKYLQVLPLLTVQVTADPAAIKSEATSYVTVHVTHNTNPMVDVAVRISSNNGSFSAETGYTDLNGDLVFNFTAPQTLTQINVSITATATKSGYFESQGQTKITVNPRVLTVQVTVSPAAIESEATSSMIVHVTDDTSPVEGANVTVSSDLGGSFSVSTGNTDSNGSFTIVFTAPKATTQLNVTVTASATKSGYLSGEKQTYILVNPPLGAAAGLPLTTILLILIPVIVVAIVAVLLKMKIIVISKEDQE